MRDNKYLENLLYDIWETSFCDVPRLNAVVIKYGKYSKRQLGSIKMIKDQRSLDRYLKRFNISKDNLENSSVSVITITKYFSQPYIPEFVVRATIVHELCHYAHGFNSPLDRKYTHPHRGGIIRKEFNRRDLSDIYLESKKWLKENWREVIS
mgnify:CR=1 FL=1